MRSKIAKFKNCKASFSSHIDALDDVAAPHVALESCGFLVVLYPSR